MQILAASTLFLDKAGRGGRGGGGGLKPYIGKTIAGQWKLGWTKQESFSEKEERMKRLHAVMKIEKRKIELRGKVGWGVFLIGGAKGGKFY